MFNITSSIFSFTESVVFTPSYKDNAPGGFFGGGCFLGPLGFPEPPPAPTETFCCLGFFTVS